MDESGAFVRYEVRKNLVVSTCVLCHRTVASGNSRLLRVAEAAHLCPKLEQAPEARQRRAVHESHQPK